jgi:outer membrane protein OmpA-like peptidoglycan-associated protein
MLATPSLHALTFYTPMSVVEWQVNRSVFECRLSHPVAGYGSAVFARGAGESEFFYLQQKQILLPVGEAKVSIASPSWHADALEQLLATTQVKADRIPLKLEQPLAQQLQAELLNGMRVIVTGTSVGESDPVYVVLDPLKFRAAQQQYLRCFKQLLPMSFAQVERTTLHFARAGDELSASDIRKLNALVVYAKADSRIKHIFIDGHTDSLGERPENLNMSKLRSERIANYLQAAGISPDRIITRWHGERYPVASNRTTEGRQKNRRLTVRLDSSS